MENRLPRFRRTTPVHFELTERDHKIIRLVERHRFIRSPQIISLIGGSKQNILRRLKFLYHRGYLERPRAQLDNYHRPGSRHIVYGLSDKSGELLQRESDGASISWGEKNRASGRMFLEHTLFVADAMAAIELACRARGIRLIASKDLLPPGKNSFEWRVVTQKHSLGVVPDQTFALEFMDANGELKRSYFFLEADRGTMPVARQNLAQTSMRRKFIAYAATWRQGLHASALGLHHFRVLTITASLARLKSLIGECSQLESGQGLFLFADKSILTGDILSGWRTAKDENSVSLLS
jgi:Replication-relaxation